MRTLAVFLLIAALRPSPARADGDVSDAEPFTPAEYAEAVSRTMSDSTVRASLGPSLTPLPLALSNFLLDHPDFSAEVVRRRGIAPYRVDMLGPRRSRADDGEGTSGIVTLVARGERRRVYYGEGVHRSLLFPDIRAAAVIVMELDEETGPDRRPRTATSFDVYVRMRSRFVAGVVRTLRPFLQKTVIGKFSKAFLVADAVGRLAAADPGALAADARAFPGLFEEDRAALLAMLAGLSPRPASASTAR